MKQRHYRLEFPKDSVVTSWPTPEDPVLRVACPVNLVCDKPQRSCRIDMNKVDTNHPGGQEQEPGSNPGTIICQQCGRTIQVPSGPKPGDRVVCPCGGNIVWAKFQGKTV